MISVTDDGFDQFCASQTAALRRIARATRGECDLDDVRHAAWVLAKKLEASGTPILFADTSYQEFLTARVYQQLARYTDKKIRTSVRLEHPTHSNDGLPLSERLADSEGDHPLISLIRREEHAAARQEADVPDTAIKGYVRLLAHFHSMRAVARHLLISVSHAYRCRADALNRTRIQPPVPTRMMEEDFLPGPWRKRRYERAPRQFAFDFDDELPFNVS